MAIDDKNWITEEAGSGCFLTRSCKITAHLELRNSVVLYNIILTPPNVNFYLTFFVSKGRDAISPFPDDDIWPTAIPYISVSQRNREKIKTECRLDGQAANCSVFKPGNTWPGHVILFTFSSDTTLTMNGTAPVDMVNDSLSVMSC